MVSYCVSTFTTEGEFLFSRVFEKRRVDLIQELVLNGLS
jgi:hypothetical protein